MNEEILKALLKTELPNRDKVLKALKDAGIVEKAADAAEGAMRLLESVKDLMPEDKRVALMKAVSECTGYPLPQAPAPAAKDAPPPAPVAKTSEDFAVPVKKSDGSYDLEKVPEALRPTITKLWAKQDELVTKAAADESARTVAEKALATERDVAKLKEFVAKAGEFKGIPLAQPELAAVLKDFSDKAPESFKKLEPVLKAASDAIMKSGLFREIGSSLPGNSDDPQAKLDSLVAGMVQKGEGKLTKEQAYVQVLESPEGRTLYTQIDARKAQPQSA